MSTTAAARATALAGLSGGVQVVELSDVLDENTILWPGAPAYKVEDVATYDNGGYHARYVSAFEHAGTHFDAPEHFVEGGETTADVAADSLVLHAVVIDITAQAAQDPNYVLTADDVARFESEHGQIPAGSAVLLRSDWSLRKPDASRYAGDPLAFPGFGVDGASVLVERGVVGVGVDTLGIDPGSVPEFTVHKEVTHPAGLWHLENLINLDQLPPTGTLLFVGVPRVGGATGFPTRVLALVPAS